MKIDRIEVEGHRDLARVDWRPADLTVLTGPGAHALAEAVFTLSQVPRGWSDLETFYSALSLPPRVTPPGEEAHTTRWRLTCSAPEGSRDRRSAEYELGIYPPAEGLGWEIRYEYLRRYDDFDEVELLRRDAMETRYELSRARRDAAKPRRTGRESFAGTISVLGARLELYEDPAVNPFAAPLAGWSWFRGFDLSAARAERVFAGFHERLWESGGNLTQALMNLCDLTSTRDAVHAAATRVSPEHEGFGFVRDDQGNVTLMQRTVSGERAAGTFGDEFARAMCAVAAVLATAPPALMWFEPAAWDVPASLGPLLAEALVGLRGRSQVVLLDPPEWLQDDLRRACGDAPSSVQRVTVELGEGTSALRVEDFVPLTGLSPVP